MSKSSYKALACLSLSCFSLSLHDVFASEQEPLDIDLLSQSYMPRNFASPIEQQTEQNSVTNETKTVKSSLSNFAQQLCDLTKQFQDDNTQEQIELKDNEQIRETVFGLTSYLGDQIDAAANATTEQERLESVDLYDFAKILDPKREDQQGVPENLYDQLINIIIIYSKNQIKTKYDLDLHPAKNTFWPAAGDENANLQSTIELWNTFVYALNHPGESTLPEDDYNHAQESLENHNRDLIEVHLPPDENGLNKDDVVQVLVNLLNTPEGSSPNETENTANNDIEIPAEIHDPDNTIQREQQQIEEEEEQDSNDSQANVDQSDNHQSNSENENNQKNSLDTLDNNEEKDEEEEGGLKENDNEKPNDQEENLSDEQSFNNSKGSESDHEQDPSVDGDNQKENRRPDLLDNTSTETSIEQGSTTYQSNESHENDDGIDNFDDKKPNKDPVDNHQSNSENENNQKNPLDTFDNNEEESLKENDNEKPNDQEQNRSDELSIGKPSFNTASDSESDLKRVTGTDASIVDNFDDLFLDDNQNNTDSASVQPENVIDGERTNVDPHQPLAEAEDDQNPLDTLDNNEEEEGGLKENDNEKPNDQEQNLSDALSSDLGRDQEQPIIITDDITKTINNLPEDLPKDNNHEEASSSSQKNSDASGNSDEELQTPPAPQTTTLPHIATTGDQNLGNQTPNQKVIPESKDRKKLRTIAVISALIATGGIAAFIYRGKIAKWWNNLTHKSSAKTKVSYR